MRTVAHCHCEGAQRASGREQVAENALDAQSGKRTTSLNCVVFCRVVVETHRSGMLVTVVRHARYKVRGFLICVAHTILRTIKQRYSCQEGCSLDFSIESVLGICIAAQFRT